MTILTESWPLGGPDWASPDEAPFSIRSIAGALSLRADIDIVCLEGDIPEHRSDSAFEVTFLASQPPAIDQLRRSIGLNLLADTFDRRYLEDNTVDQLAGAWLDRLDSKKWDSLSCYFRQTSLPDLLVLVGHQHRRITPLLERIGIPLSWVPCCRSTSQLNLPFFDNICTQAESILVMSDHESKCLTSTELCSDAAVDNVGMVVPINPSVMREPTTELADQDYILALCPTGWNDDQYESQLTRLLAMKFPDNPIAVVQPGSLVIWRKNTINGFPPVTKHMDLMRLMAWAKCVVDLRPGELLATRTLESLRLGTPVLAPAGTRAADHLAGSNGGLWYRDAYELVQCVTILLAGDTAQTMGEQGRKYADANYGSSENFIDRVHRATGIGQLSDPLLT